MYGGFTPAGGAFAVLTSIGMMGILVPFFIVPAAIIASLVTVAVGMTRDII
jgi:hypothetical protein